MRPSSGRLSIAALTIAVLAGVSGCSSAGPGDTPAVRSRLSAAVESAQDTVWVFRDRLIANTEAAIPEVWGLGDARPTFTDPTVPLAPGSFTLIGVDASEQSTVLTMMVQASETRAEFLSSSTVVGMTCFTVVLPHDAPRIDTVGFDCSDVDGVDRTELLSGGRGPDSVTFVPFDRLDVRENVDEETYRVPCQCSSGGACDCPGG